MKRYYIKATGSVCYDEKGITFPENIAVNFKGILSSICSPKVKWENQFSWTNQPEVLSFSAKEKEAREINNKLPIGLIVVEHWDN